MAIWTETRLLLLYAVFSFTITLCILKEQLMPGYYTGLAMLLMFIFCVIYFTKHHGKFWRAVNGFFALFFLFLSIKNFLSY